MFTNDKREHFLARHALFGLIVLHPRTGGENGTVFAAARHHSGVFALQTFDQFELIDVAARHSTAAPSEIDKAEQSRAEQR